MSLQIADDNLMSRLFATSNDTHDTMSTIIFKLQSPLNIRMACRDGLWQSATTGLALGFLQTNLAVLPRSLADDFAEFCALNYGPLPLLYKSAPGETVAPPLAKDSDVRWAQCGE